MRKPAVYSNLTSLQNAKMACVIASGSVDPSKSGMKIVKEAVKAVKMMQELNKCVNKLKNRNGISDELF